jgi:exopolysaccharide biosynthesis polyprenyl glycosylphosphotransferase
MATGALEAQVAEPWAGELPGPRAIDAGRLLNGALTRRRLAGALAALDPLALAAAGLLALPGAPKTAANWLLASGAMALAACWRQRHPARAELLDELRSLLAAVSLSVTVTLGLEAILGSPAPSSFALRLGVLALALGTEAILGRRWLQRIAGAALLRPTLIVGAGGVGLELAALLERDPRHGLRIVGFLDGDPRRPSSSEPARSVERDRLAAVDRAHAPLLGPPERLDQALDDSGADCVVLAFTGQPDSLLLPLVELCRRRRVAVLAVPRLYEVAHAEGARIVGALPLVALRPRDPRGAAFGAKHALDRLIAALLLGLSAPLLALLALAIRIDSPGPVLYRQRRVGRDGHHFTMLKLRTMRPAPPGEPVFVPAPGCAPGGNELGNRCTRLGAWLRRSSLDELPQLVNVLRGEMSLIGPRPERPEYVERFAADVAGYDLRHRVKAGITGLAQVHGLRGQTSIAHRARYDNAYIERWSFWLDFKIALRTIGAVLALRGR